MSYGGSQYGSSSRQDEDWSRIEDPNERRKVQNRIAQRNYRERNKAKAEETSRIEQNQAAAGAAYTAPRAEDLARNDNPNGLPWGSYSIKHVVEAGKAKQDQTSREGSSATGSGRGWGGSTR